jgi:hypothetical protein
MLVAWPVRAAAQEIATPIPQSGRTVTPVFEGWYRNPDGTFSLSFGYFNRNGAEVLEIPVGANNFIAPGSADQGQPTNFQPRRHWGVFAVTVPATFSEKDKVVWTLIARGDTVAIAASLRPQWEIDALQGEAGSGNTPPVLTFGGSDAEGRGPRGINGPAMTASVGRPLALDVHASDDGAAARSISSEGRVGVPVALMWFKHRGPGDVVFSAPTSASTTATFSASGEYVLRIRANDASGVENAGHAQCCWTNGFVKVTVSP